jgi:hypothetical protein
MAVDPNEFPKVLTLYLALSQYPILARSIRKRMRQVLFERGVISPEDFEAEVRQRAIQSQQVEGLSDPFGQEPPDVWIERMAIVRDHLTDFYFAYNLPYDEFEELLRDTLANRMPTQDIVLTIHPELAPWDILFAQGEHYESMSEEERNPVEHHLKEIKVVIIKAMISDHLSYLGIAKEWLDVSDLQLIRDRRLGRGKIGGKAAGVVLADAILRKSGDPMLREHFEIPQSWFVGADVFYHFTQLNNLFIYANQKYKSAEEITSEYPEIRQAYEDGKFPEEIEEGLRQILQQIGRQPLIVRSSSLLEDSFGTSFAGKYESHFCANQGSPEENLQRLLAAIRKVYASVKSPNVLLYRRRMGLSDYDERMAILIQEVQGRPVGRFYFPDAAGVAFSRNQFRWHPRIDRQAGFLRLVWGLGTRAVDQIGDDFPRLVALSHPELRPESDPMQIRRHSQANVDLIDLQDNRFRTLPINEALSRQTPNLRLLVQRFEQEGFHDFLSLPPKLDLDTAVVTLEGLLRRTPFPSLMRRMLARLESAYKSPVDTEFAATFVQEDGEYKPIIHVLQCRPQSRLLNEEEVHMPDEIPVERRLFVTHGMIPDGRVTGIRYVVYVPPARYSENNPTQKIEIARLIGRLNNALSEHRFILIGPGRWGSRNSDLGIPVTYADIYNAKALIEVTDETIAAEPSYGTHFFQDLVEANIYPLALPLDDEGAEFNHAFFGAENNLHNLLPNDTELASVVRLIDVPVASNGALVEIVMDGDAGTAIAYLKPSDDDHLPL